MPLDVRDPAFFDEVKLDAELTRVFDVCHGCRMCFNYCPSFPALFDAVDEHETKGDGEVEALTQPEKWKVVDLCYQCKLCYVKCPYTPPHAFNVDFPRLMLRAKATRARREGVTRQDAILGDPDRTARLAAGPLAPLANWANGSPVVRGVLERAVGIHRDRVLPPFARERFATWLARRPAPDAPRSVAVFETCAVNYNYPHIGAAAVQVLEHNGFRVLRPAQRCCGMPALDGGDVDAASASAQANVESLLPFVEDDVPVVMLGPTCGYTAKHEWPALVGTDEAARVAAHVQDLGVFLSREHAAGRLRRDFARPQGKLAYHVACHLRAQNVGAPFTALLGLVPDTSVEPIEKCSAFDGTWGMKVEYYEQSRKWAKKLTRAFDDVAADRLVSDCPLAGLNVTEELGVTPAHPIEVLRDAYGLSPALPAAENVWPGGSIAGCGKEACAGGWCKKAAT
jgi:glycerol-3-phosphate dehydrogenase subunit C